MLDMNAAIYARVSTDKSLKRQDTETQLMPLREYCKRQGWNLVREYVDDISATKYRPSYEQLLKESKQRLFNIVVIYKLDRMFRSTREFLNKIEDLDTHNIRFVCTDQPIDTNKNDPASRLLMQIVAAVAEFERTLISDRVKAGIARKIAGGFKWSNWKVGRRKVKIDIEEVKRLKAEGYHYTEIAKLLGVNRNIISATVRGMRE